MSVEILLLFTITTALACFTPGPAAMFVASVGTSRRTRLVGHAIAGIALANVVYFVLSAAGIASLIIASPRLYQLIRWLGAAYLIYLGLRLVFAARTPSHEEVLPAIQAHARWTVLAKGFVIEMGNPKALVYFSALLPQFITPSAPLVSQFVSFCAITVVLDVLAYTFYGALGFGVARFAAVSLLDGIRRLAGIAFVFAGVRLVSD